MLARIFFFFLWWLCRPCFYLYSDRLKLTWLCLTFIVVSENFLSDIGDLWIPFVRKAPQPNMSAGLLLSYERLFSLFYLLGIDVEDEIAYG